MYAFFIRPCDSSLRFTTLFCDKLNCPVETNQIWFMSVHKSKYVSTYQHDAKLFPHIFINQFAKLSSE